MTRGQYCHSCGGFYHHGHICCYENRDDGSNIQNVVLVNNTTTYTETECNSYSSSSSSAFVDCTLSLGTPSTRLSEKDEKNKGSASSSISNFSDTSKTSPYNALPCSRRGVSSGSDTLLDHRCTNCVTTSTPLWRNGPRGPKSLCNACGIRFKRREKRTTTAVTAGSNVEKDQYGNQSSHDAAINI